jgi:DNA-binding NtrC family response regulator
MVVCIDDDEAVLQSVVRCLRREALTVRATMSAIEALSWIAVDEIAVLVSDYDMPEMTGAQLAGQARRLRPETVRILLTGKRTLETAIDGIHQGEIFRFLNKPFENEQLRAAVLEGVARNRELCEISGERERRARRAQLTSALEAEYPGISEVPARRSHELYEIAADPWSEAALIGLGALAGTREPGM